MSMLISARMQVPPLVKFQTKLTNNVKDKITLRQCYKDKVVVVVGSTGTGKSRLAIELASSYGGEIINSDKIQVYNGLDIIANKVTDEQRRGVPHHLLGVIDPDDDFTAEDFVHHASLAMKRITERGHLPIIAGGSYSFIEALVRDNSASGGKHEFCFLWVDVAMHILHSFLSTRVDKMVERGLVEEARAFFKPNGDYSRGVRRAIGVPEMDEFFRNEASVDDETRAKILKAAIDQIVENTRKLSRRQVEKVSRLEEELGWPVLRLDATDAFLSCGAYAAETWEKTVVRPSTRRLSRFLSGEKDKFV